MDERKINIKVTHAKEWSERLLEASANFKAGKLSIAGYALEIKAVREVKNLAIADAVIGHQTFLKDEITSKIITIEVK